MLANQSVNDILSRLLDRVPEDFDKREGNLIYTDLSSDSLEFKKIYDFLDFLSEQQSPLTADRNFLEGWAEPFNIIPRQPTYAILKASIVMNDGYELPIGSRFNQEMLSFIVLEKEADTIYSVQCEQAGETGNTAYGQILPVVNIPGLVSAHIVGLEIPGTELESDESLLNRFLEHFTQKAFGGNMADYRQKVLSIQGVGGVKCFRLFEGKELHVGVYIMDSQQKVPTKELIDLVQETLHPLIDGYEEAVIENSGDGIIPIGHIVHVLPVEEEIVNVHLHLDLSTLVSYDEIAEEVESTIENVINNTNKDWGIEKEVYVRIRDIENAVYAIEGVRECYDTEINGVMSNYTLGDINIAKLGQVTVDVE